MPRADRELIILRAAQNMHGLYQYRQHVPMAISCGMTRAQIEALPRWRESELFSERQRAILAYADGMVSAQGVTDAVFEAMKKFSSTREIVELTMTGAYYSGSAQITRALGVQPEKDETRTRPGMGDVEIVRDVPPMSHDNVGRRVPPHTSTGGLSRLQERYLRSRTFRTTSFDNWMTSSLSCLFSSRRASGRHPRNSLRRVWFAPAVENLIGAAVPITHPPFMTS